MDLSHASHKKLCDCAGNGMHVPSVGFAVLTAVLALQPVKNSTGKIVTKAVLEKIDVAYVSFSSSWRAGKA